MFVWCICPILVIIGLADAFTLEPRLAIVKKGSPGSYFGFAVTGHPFARNRRSLENVVLVGAPLNQGGGALWSCPYTNLDHDCYQVAIGKRGRGNHSDSMEEEWFGATVHSQSSGNEKNEAIYAKGITNRRMQVHFQAHSRVLDHIAQSVYRAGQSIGVIQERFFGSKLVSNKKETKRFLQFLPMLRKQVLATFQNTLLEHQHED